MRYTFPLRDKIIASVFLVQVIALGAVYGFRKVVEPPELMNITADKVIDSNGLIRGETAAPYTLVEFGDYECPPCASMYPRIERKLAQHADKIRFEFRQFPLTAIHPVAQPAAEAAVQCRDTGKYWQVHGMLYSQQHIMNDEFLYSLVRAYGKPGLAEARKKIRQDIADGKAIGVEGTPALFLCTPQGRVYRIHDVEQIENVLR